MAHPRRRRRGAPLRKVLALALDPRITPFRADLAAESLRGQISAPRYAPAVSKRVIAAIAGLHRAPADDAPLETQALFGEAVDVYDERDGWCWAQLTRDGYVGHLKSAALGAPLAATHRVSALRAHLYPAATIKVPPVMALSMGALVRVADDAPPFARLSSGGFVIAGHLAPLAAAAADFVAVAQKFLHAPYLWGGRTSEGIDCSGLVQAALAATGVAAPRDTDMQEKALGAAIDAAGAPKRGDLVFWKGHIGTMLDAATLLHANGHHMMVVAEPLAEAVRRTQEKGGGEVTSIRRLNI